MEQKAYIKGVNVCEIMANGGEYLQSYCTVVAFKKWGEPTIIKVGQPQSVTTAKHITQWLGEPYKAAIKSGRAIYGILPEF